MTIEHETEHVQSIQGVIHVTDKGQDYLCSGFLSAPCVNKLAAIPTSHGMSYLDLFSVNGCPEFIRMEGSTYQYAGVSDGTAFYTEVEAVKP